jgi:hypothetical protein
MITRYSRKPYWHEGLVTFVQGADYDKAHKAGKLFMGKRCCCHMRGCIEAFCKIDPDVSLIETFAGEVPDTIYQRIDGRWCAFRARPSN